MQLSRSDWQADSELPRRGHPIGAPRRTEVYVHHTAIVDSDATPNDWETLDTVKSAMRRLQRVRPDLGRDVPYNMVAFFMRDGDLIMCEGRGLYRTGAHTKGHNRSALGVAFQGNFENFAVRRHIDSQLGQFAQWLRMLRNELGFHNLGNVRPDGKQVWGHRDSPKARTLCPGANLYSKLDKIRFIDDEDDTAMDKSTWKIVQNALQAQVPSLYSGRKIDGQPGRNTQIAIRAFERRMALEPRGVVGTLGDPGASMWPATRELLFVTARITLTA
jgi:peptidoglycan hydrolase-like protein with peptidoglycan-binding domain